MSKHLPPSPDCCRPDRGSFGFCFTALAIIAWKKGLSPRQVQVARLILAGKTERQIARALDVAESTVHTHVRALCEKLDAEGHVGIVTALCTEHTSWLAEPLKALRPPEVCPLMGLH